MSNKIKFVSFENFVIDMNNNNSVYLSYENEEGETESIGIGKYVNISLDGDSIDFKIKESKDMLKGEIKTYSKSLLFLEKNPFVKKALKDFYSEKIFANKEVFVVKGLKNYLIGEKIDKIDIKLNELDEQRKITQSEQKSDLKVYETPDKVYDIIFSLIQKENIKPTLNDMLSRISSDILTELSTQKDSKLNKKIVKILKSRNRYSILNSIAESYYSTTKEHAIDVLSDDDEIAIIKDYLDANYPKLKKDIKEIYEADFPYTKLEKETLEEISTLPFIDLQAGSGEGILSSATKTSFPMLLQGTEFRSFENLGLDKENLDDRYQVSTGKNFLLHKNDAKRAFNNGSLVKAVLNTPVYLNPPYNSNNLIAKESIEVLKHKQPVFGLFPTSMKNFLNENISGHIFEITKDLTGYTDPKAPETFLFIVGNRYDYEYIELQIEESRKMNKNFTIGNSFEKNTFYKKIASSSVSEAVREIRKQININSEKYNFGANIQSMQSYYNVYGGSQNSRLQNLRTALNDYMDKTVLNIQNSSKIKEALEKKSEHIRQEFSSENMLVKEKVFPMYQFFDKKEKTKYLDFYEVINNQGLLVCYRDNYPEIMNIVKAIANKEGIDISLAINSSTLYDLDNPKLPEKKDKKVSENIGLLKNHYLPSSYDLYSKENKEHMMKIINKTYNNLGSSLSVASQNLLENILKTSSRMVTKLETAIKDDKKIQKDEVFVFLDEDGLDIGKLNVSKTDFNKTLEELNYFDIDNYIEIADLSKEKKSIVMQNYLKHMENNVFVLNKFNKSNTLDKKIQDSLLEILTLNKMKSLSKIDKTEYSNKLNSVYVKFMNENNIVNFFNSNINFDNKVFKAFERSILKNENLMHLDKKEKTKISEIIFNLYNKSPLDFFEYKRVDTEKYIEDLIVSAIKEKDNTLVLTDKNISALLIDMYNTLSQDFVKNKAVFNASLRMSKMFISNYGYSKAKTNALKNANKEIDYSELYDELFDKIVMNTLGLMPHQHKTAERYLEISEEQKHDIKAWEMRAGKTLGFLETMYLLTLLNKEDGYVMLESKNFDDISLQMLAHMPHMFMSSNFYLTDGQVNKTIASSGNTYSHLIMAEYYPNAVKVLTPFYSSKGVMAKEESENYTYEFEKLLETLEERDYTKEEFKELHKDSRFIDLLEISCMKNM